jgi:hypothetical protein
MRKVSPAIVWCVLLGVFALVLGACIKPVDLSGFFDNEIVKEIMGEEEQPEPEPGPEQGAEGEIVYEHPGNYVPKLRVGTRNLTEGDTIVISLSSGPAVIIDVDNLLDYDSPRVVWFHYDDSLDRFEFLANNDGLTVRAVSPVYSLFDKVGIYQLVAIGTKDGVPYSTGIYIWVDN